MGLYLEEFEIGKVYKSQGRTITEADIVNFAGISGDWNPLHTDDEFAKGNAFGKRIAHGALGVAIATGLSNLTGIFEGTTIAFMEMTVKYRSPLCIGDTIHLEMVPTEHIFKKPGKGILKITANIVNQDGVLVTEMPWTIMMKTKQQ